MLLPGVGGKFSGSVSNHPDVDPKLAGLDIDSYDVGLAQLEISVWGGRLDIVTASGVSKHAIACHLDIDDVFGAVPKGVRQYPLDSLSTSGQSL